MEDERSRWMHRFHLGDDTVSGAGLLEVRRGGGLAGRLACVALRLPRTGVAVPATVLVERTAGRWPRDADRPPPVVERWVRRIGSRNLNSRQLRTGERVRERVGPLELRMRYVTEGSSLRLALTALAVGTLASALRDAYAVRGFPRPSARWPWSARAAEPASRAPADPPA